MPKHYERPNRDDRVRELKVDDERDSSKAGGAKPQYRSGYASTSFSSSIPHQPTRSLLTPLSATYSAKSSDLNLELNKPLELSRSEENACCGTSVAKERHDRNAIKPYARPGSTILCDNNYLLVFSFVSVLLNFSVRFLSVLFCTRIVIYLRFSCS